MSFCSSVPCRRGIEGRHGTSHSASVARPHCSSIEHLLEDAEALAPVLHGVVDGIEPLFNDGLLGSPRRTSSGRPSSASHRARAGAGGGRRIPWPCA